MYKPLALVLACILLTGQSTAQEAAVDISATTEAIAPETIVISGQRPGPGLWKVSKGDHTLWLFGSYGPLPKDLQWRSRQVEALLAQSQAVLYPTNAIYNPGFFRGLTLLPRLIGFKKNPDGATLRDRLTPDVYARWQVLKGKYIGDDDSVERYRPYFAADLLYQKGLEKAGLIGGGQIFSTIDQMARMHKVKTIHPRLALKVDDPAALLKRYKETPLDDAACFAATMSRLETDIAILRMRAEAWAKGDLETIRAAGFDEREAACATAFLQSPAFKDIMASQASEARMREAWLGAAREALENNKSTLAILPIKTLLEAGQEIAALRAQGYTVEAPE